MSGHFWLSDGWRLSRAFEEPARDAATAGRAVRFLAWRGSGPCLPGWQADIAVSFFNPNPFRSNTGLFPMP